MSAQDASMTATRGITRKAFGFHVDCSESDRFCLCEDNLATSDLYPLDREDLGGDRGEGVLTAVIAGKASEGSRSNECNDKS